MIYKYKAISQRGESIEGFFEGNDEADVLAMLKGNNYLPISIEKDSGTVTEVHIFSAKVGKKDLAVFCRQFYTMLNAGIGIVKCMEILEKQTENKSLIKALETLGENVQKGFALSESMKKHTKVFPPLLINMVEAGEVSGNLDTIMERMAIHFEKENKLENKIKSAFMYPAVLSVVTVAVVIFMLVGVMPTFVGMFEASGQTLPQLTLLLLNISNWMTKYWYIFIFFSIIITVGSMMFMKSAEGRRFFDSLKITVPIVKNTNIKIITSRFTRTLSTLMDSGIPLLQAMDVVSRVVGNTVVLDKLTVASENVRKGIPLSKAIHDMKVFPPMVDSMIKIGEESGTLDDILNKTADFYDEEVETALQRMTTLMEPILIVVMALLIGFIVIAMVLPLFDMVNTIQ